MKIHPEYIRDMHYHYMVLMGKEESENYATKMLTNNLIPGILRTELRYMDNQELLYYDITHKKNIKALYESQTFSYEILKKIIVNILKIIESSEEYLLIEHDFIISPEYIYLDNNDLLSLCYLSGYGQNILEQLSYFFEYLMNKIDYKEEAAVKLIYALYKESKDLECTFDKLHEIIEHSYGSQNFNLSQEEKEKSNYGITEELDNVREMIHDEEGTQKTCTSKIENANGLKKNSSQKSNKAKVSKKSKDTLINTIKLLSSNVFKGEKRSTRAPINTYYIKSHRDKNEVVNEKEVYYYPTINYVIAGVCIMGGVGILLFMYFSGIFRDSFGNDLNSVKFLACILVVACIEIYIMTKIFASNRRCTKMKAVVEYGVEAEDDRKDKISCDNNSKYTSNDLCKWNESVRNNRNQVQENISDVWNIKESKDDKKDEVTGEETQVLWNSFDSNQDEKTQVLTYIPQRKSYYLNPINTKANNKEYYDKVKIEEYPFYIGKNENLVNMIIRDKSVSRKHSVITCKEDKLFITDLNSTNGTFINGIKLEPNKPYEISPHDEIAFSNIKYIIEERNDE